MTKPSQTQAQSEAQKEAIRVARVADAYKEVFGANPKKRTLAQSIVWEDLQKVGFVKSPVFMGDKSGALCPLRAAHADGRRWVWLYVEGNVGADVKIPQ